MPKSEIRVGGRIGESDLGTKPHAAKQRRAFLSRQRRRPITAGLVSSFVARLEKEAGAIAQSRIWSVWGSHARSRCVFWGRRALPQTPPGLGATWCGHPHALRAAPPAALFSRDARRRRRVRLPTALHLCRRPRCSRLAANDGRISSEWSASEDRVFGVNLVDIQNKMLMYLDVLFLPIGGLTRCLIAAYGLLAPRVARIDETEASFTCVPSGRSHSVLDK
jgi:hypothetical protein